MLKENILKSSQPDEIIGQLWAKRYPKIKIVHMLCNTKGKESKKVLNIFQNYWMLLIGHMNNL